MVVEPLNHTKLEDVGLDTCNHDIPFNSREVSSFDELEPQLQPLPTCPTLDMIKDDCELESKEVSFLGRGLTLPVKPKEVILDEESPEVLWKLEGGVK
ncbi:hypothetical protein Tco_1398651 [Tanacetum coccineum]